MRIQHSSDIGIADFRLSLLLALRHVQRVICISNQRHDQRNQQHFGLGRQDNHCSVGFADRFVGLGLADFDPPVVVINVSPNKVEDFLPPHSRINAQMDRQCHVIVIWDATFLTGFQNSF